MKSKPDLFTDAGLLRSDLYFIQERLTEGKRTLRHPFTYTTDSPTPIPATLKPSTDLPPADAPEFILGVAACLVA